MDIAKSAHVSFSYAGNIRKRISVGLGSLRYTGSDINADFSVHIDDLQSFLDNPRYNLHPWRKCKRTDLNGKEKVQNRKKGSVVVVASSFHHQVTFNKFQITQTFDQSKRFYLRYQFIIVLFCESINLFVDLTIWILTGNLSSYNEFWESL